MQLILGLFLAVRARRAGGLLGLLGQVGRLLLFLVLEVLSCGFINLKSFKNRTVRLKLICWISSSSQLRLCYEITSIDNTIVQKVLQITVGFLPSVFRKISDLPSVFSGFFQKSNFHFSPGTKILTFPSSKCEILISDLLSDRSEIEHES